MPTRQGHAVHSQRRCVSPENMADVLPRPPRMQRASYKEAFNHLMTLRNHCTYYIYCQMCLRQIYTRYPIEKCSECIEEDFNLTLNRRVVFSLSFSVSGQFLRELNKHVCMVLKRCSFLKSTLFLIKFYKVIYLYA